MSRTAHVLIKKRSRRQAYHTHHTQSHHNNNHEGYHHHRCSHYHPSNCYFARLRRSHAPAHQLGDWWLSARLQTALLWLRMLPGHVPRLQALRLDQLHNHLILSQRFSFGDTKADVKVAGQSHRPSKHAQQELTSLHCRQNIQEKLSLAPYREIGRRECPADFGIQEEEEEEDLVIIQQTRSVWPEHCPCAYSR